MDIGLQNLGSHKIGKNKKNKKKRKEVKTGAVKLITGNTIYQFFVNFVFFNLFFRNDIYTIGQYT